MDRMISIYRIRARTNKWTVKAILHFIDLSVVNAWILYKQDQIVFQKTKKDILCYLDFKILVAEYFLTNRGEDDEISSTLRSGARRSREEERPRTSSKTDAMHLPAIDDKKKRRKMQASRLHNEN